MAPPYDVIGMKYAGGWFDQRPTKSAGATPTIVYSTEPIWIVDPRISRRPPYSVCHRAYLATATGAPLGGVSSAGPKYRPSAGGASKNWKNVADTMAIGISRDASPTPTARSREVN